ncbi:MAG: LPS export ABC transporter periplasmic protein LptC [Rhodospirillales bacterium]
MPTTENSGSAAKATARTRAADALGARPILDGAKRLAARRRYTHRYTRFVHMMKYLLPTVAMVLVALVAVWPHLKTQDSGFRIGFSALKARETGEPAMVNARYMGSDKNNQLFSITADLVRNAMKDAATVELVMPKADITLEDGSWLVLTAEAGVFNRAAMTLELAGAVNLFHDSGYEFRTERITIDLDNGSAVGTEPVEGQGPFGDLSGEGFVLREKGKTIIFTGKARLFIYPGIGRPGQ